MTQTRGLSDLIGRRARSFQYAFSGCWHVLRTQPNAWIHGAISLGVIALAIWLRLPGRDWAILILTMTVVWVAEFFNTAMEGLVDLASPDIDPRAKTVKDVTAAAVLVGAVGAILVGLLILGPPLQEQLF